MSDHGGHTRRARGAAAVVALVALAGACKQTGDLRSEAPGQNAAAAGTVDHNQGAAVSASGGVANGSVNNPTNNDRDTTALPGMAGSGTASVGRPSGAPGVPGAGPLHSGDPSDADVRLVVGAIHKTEVDAAQLATTKAQNPGVKAYAQQMLRVHGGPARSAPTPGGGAMSGASDLLVPMQENATKTLTALQAASGPAFDRAYVTSQVASHQGALQTLSRLETATKDKGLLQQVRTLEGDVQRHLEAARKLQASLGGAT